MNNYEVTKCPKCGDVIITSEVGTIKVTGATELQKVVSRLQNGETLDNVAKDYCLYCLFPIKDHATREEYGQHPDWLPYHEPQPQKEVNRYC